MKRLQFRRGVALALTLAVLAATAMALWLGVFRQDQAAAAADAGLQVTVASDPASGETMAPGSVISYDVTVDSDAAIDVADDNITLTINLSNATLVGSPSSADGITCAGTNPIGCEVPEFSGAGTKTVSFDAQVGASGPVLVGAVLDPPIDRSGPGEVDEGPPDPDFDDDDGDDETLECGTVGEETDPSDDEPDNFDCTSHAVGNADLTITKTASPSEATVLSQGSTVTYTLTASNDSLAAGTATDVVIRDYIGVGLTFESATTGTGVTCTDTTPPQINCTAASIAPGENRTVTIEVTVSATTGTVQNGARVDPADLIEEDNDDADDPDLFCGGVGEGGDLPAATEPDNYDCTAHTVVTLPDLTITKTASPSETTVVATGGTITYTLTASNSGSAAAASVPIRDYIGDGLTFVSATPGSEVTCDDITPPEINCTATSIASGQSRTVTIVVTVAATSGVVLNGARVDPLNAITEMNEDADEPTLDCSLVGEGTDAGDATEADNYDCTSHSLTALSPTPTAGQLLNCPLSGKWAISVWDGPSGTATATALATCTGVTIDAAYALDGITNLWSHYFPGRPDINNLLTLADMQAIFTVAR
jgi:uncharacterized repeat protein (TIGR01451 family)/fimbrial isopeptide formation D2 family protein